MSDLSLRIRHAKRSGDSKIDISGLSLASIPSELFELPHLENIDISNNSLKNLDKIHIFKNLKTLIASKNKINSIPDSILELKNLETLRLDGNPISVSNNKLGVLFGSDIKKELTAHFGGGSGDSDVSSLQKKIAELKAEVTTLKGGGSPGVGVRGMNSTGVPDWLNPSAGGMAFERPSTASSQAK